MVKKQGGLGKSFRKGISLIEAVQNFGDEAAAEAWFINQRWPDGVRCAHCNSDRISVRANRKPQPYHCKDCRKYFSVRTNSVLQASNLPLNKWAIAFFLYSTNLKGVSSMKLHRDLGITQKSAWHMAHRVRECWTPTEEKFAGPVEADETYIGGKESNKHEWKKLRAGRGTVGKAPVAGVLDRATNQIEARAVAATDARTLQGFVQQRTEADAMVYTDEARAYQGIRRPHESVKHGVKPESTDGRHEGWANWDEGAYKGESLGSIGTDVTPQRVSSSRTGPRERSMEAGNRVIVRSDAAGCTRGSGGREFGGVGSVADSAVRLGVGWLAVGPGREWPAQPRASPGEDAK